MSLGVVAGGGGTGAAARARVKGMRRAAARELERGWKRVHYFHQRTKAFVPEHVFDVQTVHWSGGKPMEEEST
jgi:hypothetical protein